MAIQWPSSTFLPAHQKVDKILTDEERPWKPGFTQKTDLLTGKNRSYYGYSPHFAVDTRSGFPLSGDLTPASVHDSQMAIPLMANLVQEGHRFRWAVMDAAYDSHDIYSMFGQTFGVQTIV